MRHSYSVDTATGSNSGSSVLLKDAWTMAGIEPPTPILKDGTADHWPTGSSKSHAYLDSLTKCTLRTMFLPDKLFGKKLLSLNFLSIELLNKILWRWIQTANLLRKLGAAALSRGWSGPCFSAMKSGGEPGSELLSYWVQVPGDNSRAWERQGGLPWHQQWFCRCSGPWRGGAEPEGHRHYFPVHGSFGLPDRKFFFPRTFNTLHPQ